MLAARDFLCLLPCWLLVLHVERRGAAACLACPPQVRPARRQPGSKPAAGDELGGTLPPVQSMLHVSHAWQHSICRSVRLYKGTTPRLKEPAWGCRSARAPARARPQAGGILGRRFQPHESHVPYLLQVKVDFNLYGMGFMRLSRVLFRCGRGRRGLGWCLGCVGAAQGGGRQRRACSCRSPEL